MLGVEPRVRYAKSSDGVDIAWYEIGSGEPYLWGVSPVDAGLIDSWNTPEVRGVYEWLGQRLRLVVFDPRGFGLSARAVTDFSCEAFVRDFEAVIETAELDLPILQTFGAMSIPAVVFAARHPDQVRGLVLSNGILSGSDRPELWNLVEQVAAEDWSLGRSMLHRGGANFSSNVSLGKVDQRLTRAVSQEAFLAYSAALPEWDASAVAGRVEAPALVTYSQPERFTPSDASRRFAASLPNATYAPITGPDAEAHMLSLGRAINRFLKDIVPTFRREVSTSTREVTPRFGSYGMAVILFTDIADSTELTERHGDQAFRKSSRALDSAIRTTILAHEGTPVAGKVLGDGVMGVFQSAANAIDCARACVAAAAASDLSVHVGLHAGDVIHEDNNVYGGAVNIASRVCQLSEPGEVLVSGTVRELARTSSAVTLDDRGEHSFKGVAEAVRVFALRLDQSH
jgi:class 3 adenylate cyclase/alpha-beta hydrolase superfamily lysophospholipase